MPLSSELLEDIRSNKYTDKNLTIRLFIDEEIDEYVGITQKECVELAEALSHNSHVTDLDLSSQYDIGDLGIQAISKLTNIQKLRIDGIGITLQGIQSLNDNTNLKSLNLGCNSLGKEHARLIAQHPSVTDLNLYQNSITEEGITAFKDNTMLRRLDLCNNRVYSEDIEKLCNDNKTIEHLGLSFNKLTNDCIPMLMRMPSLTSVNLNSNDDLSPAAYTPMQEMLAKRKKEIELRDVKEERTENPISFRKLF